MLAIGWFLFNPELLDLSQAEKQLTISLLGLISGPLTWRKTQLRSKQYIWKRLVEHIIEKRFSAKEYTTIDYISFKCAVMQMHTN